MFHVERCGAVVAGFFRGTQQAGAIAAIRGTRRRELPHLRPRARGAPPAVRRGRRCAHTEAEDNRTARLRYHTAKIRRCLRGDKAPLWLCAEPPSAKNTARQISAIAWERPTKLSSQSG